MSDILLITELLKENFPVECETAGPTNLQDIAEAEVGFEPTEYGSHMDLQSAIGTLVIAATFIKSAIEIYTSLKKELRREPQEDEIEIRIITKREIVQSLDKGTRDRLMRATIWKLKEEKYDV
jgi:hypothetical protein